MDVVMLQKGMRCQFNGLNFKLHFIRRTQVKYMLIEDNLVCFFLFAIVNFCGMFFGMTLPAIVLPKQAKSSNMAVLGALLRTPALWCRNLCLGAYCSNIAGTDAWR